MTAWSTCKNLTTQRLPSWPTVHRGSEQVVQGAVKGVDYESDAHCLA